MSIKDSESNVPTGPQLFLLCATHPERDEYWELFIQRFNPLFTRCIVVAWRRHGQGFWPPIDVTEDLLQEIYATILKNDARLLQNFRGNTEAEAEAYLARTAINITTSYLRALTAQKRAGEEISLQMLLDNQGDTVLPKSPENSLQSVTEREFLEILHHLFDGPNSERDILILLLYAREGYSPAEIARLKICDLKESSIANLLAQMKSKLKKYFSGTL
jgi:RNA polymerase sigma factor (sigma-70 family)